MFIKNYKDFLFEVRDKKHEPAGEKTENDHKKGNHEGPLVNASLSQGSSRR